MLLSNVSGLVASLRSVIDSTVKDSSVCQG